MEKNSNKYVVVDTNTQAPYPIDIAEPFFSVVEGEFTYGRDYLCFEKDLDISGYELTENLFGNSPISIGLSAIHIYKNCVVFVGNHSKASASWVYSSGKLGNISTMVYLRQLKG